MIFRASRIGTPLATSVPSVRVVRAIVFFSTSCPKTGIFSVNRSQPTRPYSNLRNSLTISQMPIGMPGIRNQYLYVHVRNSHQHDGDRREIGLEIVEDLLKRGHDLDHDEREDADGHRDHDDRIDHGAFDLALERLRSLHELGQAAENDFQRTAGLAGLDHVHVQAVEGLGAFRHGLAERRAAFDLVADVHQAVFEAARLTLPLQNSQAAQDRQAGVLQDGELPREGGLGLEFTPPIANERVFLPVFVASSFFRAFFTRDLGDEVAHLPDRRLGFGFAGGVDHVLDLLPGRVHRFELISRHRRTRRQQVAVLQIVVPIVAVCARSQSAVLRFQNRFADHFLGRRMPPYTASMPASRSVTMP